VPVAAASTGCSETSATPKARGEGILTGTGGGVYTEAAVTADRAGAVSAGSALWPRTTGTRGAGPCAHAAGGACRGTGRVGMVPLSEGTYRIGGPPMGPQPAGPQGPAPLRDGTATSQTTAGTA